MAATVEDLDFMAPAVAGMPLADKQKALTFAEAYRPACLSEAKQDEAQLLYAAWLLYGRLRQQEGGVIPAGVKSLKEGDVAVTYGSGADGGDLTDPLGFYGRWNKLNRLCGVGAITASNWRSHCC
ncbi:DUF4054 domain-containing protein [Paracandidimonas lactea]|uniref:DUF4054 domain-containing protein n=1 Tax=Paracandidimonas lactea TaxID=2895524 RepID=UPI001F17F41D|nr:DUF4054 domain-containing protein [Paracandidimonas lactea]